MYIFSHSYARLSTCVPVWTASVSDVLLLEHCAVQRQLIANSRWTVVTIVSEYVNDDKEWDLKKNGKNGKDVQKWQPGEHATSSAVCLSHLSKYCISRIEPVDEINCLLICQLTSYHCELWFRVEGVRKRTCGFSTKYMIANGCIRTMRTPVFRTRHGKAKWKSIICQIHCRAKMVCISRLDFWKIISEREISLDNNFTFWW